jgi:hypothetical protein
MSLYYLLFIFSALAWRIGRNAKLTLADIQQLLINNTVVYISAIIVFDKGSLHAEPGIVTGCMFLITGLFALISSRLFSSEQLLQRSLVWQSLVLLLLFIAFQWDGLTVTLLWVAVSVLLFTWGIYGQKSWARLAAVLLIGITLGKLLFFDSDRFSTVQKISCYIIIGILLLLFSFYYQKPGLSKKQDS